MSPDDAAMHNEMDELAEEYAQLLREKQNPDIKTYLARFAGDKEELRELLESIATIEGLKQGPELQDHSGTSDSELQVLQQIDDYKIIREIGRGGMGIVYEAIHQSLERRVALKVLSSSLLGDPKHIARFRREARAAARLRHSNIVPVFGVGLSEQCHYYVMDLIEGQSLRSHMQHSLANISQEPPTMASSDAASNDDFSFADNSPTEIQNVQKISQATNRVSSHRPSSTPGTSPASDKRVGLQAVPTPASSSEEYFHWVAKLGADVAEALHYAHQQGVLHRDIKPANLLLDRDGEVWIADFGLAKLAEQGEFTKTGELLGTPQYLPPETFQGNYDPQSEQYAVALTLYELVALRPAVQGKNSAETLRLASQGVSTVPSSHNRQIPRDLETVIMKSLAQAPEHRYTSVAEMGSDLRRFVSGHPISARRVGVAERSLRWTRREPVLASFASAVVLLLVLLAGVSAFGYWTTRTALKNEQKASREARNSTAAANSALAQKTEALLAAEAQRVRAEKNLQTARRAFQQIMQNVIDRGAELDAEILGEASETTAASVSPKDAELLRTLLGFFDELARNNSNELIFESAQAAHLAGDIYVSLGQLSRSRESYTSAQTRYRELCKHHPNNVEYLAAFADLLNDLLSVNSLTGQLGRSMQPFQDAMRFLESHPAAMKHPDTRFQLARAYRLRASFGVRQNWGPMLGVNFGANMGASFGGSPVAPIKARKRHEEDRRLVLRSLDMLDALVEDDAANLGKYQLELARGYRTLAEVQQRSANPRASEEALAESLRIFQLLLDANPKSAGLRYELATTLTISRQPIAIQEKRAEQASRLSRDLLNEAPEMARYEALFAQVREMSGAVAHRKQNYARAEIAYEQAIRSYSKLLADSREVKAYQIRRAQTLAALARVKVDKGEPESAAELLDRAIRRLQPKFAGRRDASPFEKRFLDRLNTEIAKLKDNAE